MADENKTFIYWEDTTFDFTKNTYTRWLDFIDKELYKPDRNWELIVLFWHPSMWKTEFAFFVMRNNIKLWIPTIFFWLEIGKKAIIQRACLKMVWVDQNQYDSGNVSDYQKTMLEEKRKKMETDFGDVLVWISKTPTIDELIAEMDRQFWWWCKLFIVDNLWKIDMEWKTENEAFANISSKLQTFALSNRVQVILLHHVIKQSSTKGKEIDDIFDLKPAGDEWFRGSKKIKDNAIRMIEIYRKFDSNDVFLFQYKHTPTGKRWMVQLIFEQWEYMEEAF